MPFQYLDHEADVGIRVWGPTLEDAFREGAKAMFGFMADISKVRPRAKVDISCDAVDIPSLFVEWLNALLSKKDINNLIFSEFEVKIGKKGKDYTLTGVACGEAPDPQRHKLKTEVKAATYSGLKFERLKGNVYLTCVLDI